MRAKYLNIFWQKHRNWFVILNIFWVNYSLDRLVNMEIQNLIAIVAISVENLLPESETKNNNTINESNSVTEVKSMARPDSRKGKISLIWVDLFDTCDQSRIRVIISSSYNSPVFLGRNRSRRVYSRHLAIKIYK